MLAEQVGVEVGQLDGVADLLDLSDQPADVVVVDLGDLFEDELLDLALRDPLVDVGRPAVQQQRVTGAHRCVAQRLGDAHDPLLVGVADHEGALAVLEHLLEHDDVADLLELHRPHDVERLVEHDLLATAQRLGLDARAHRDPQLAATGEHVDRAVVVRGEEDAETGRRLGQPVDLFLELDDLLARLAQRRGEPVVVRAPSGEIGSRLDQAVLELAHMTRCVGELAAKRIRALPAAGPLGAGVRRHLVLARSVTPRSAGVLGSTTSTLPASGVGSGPAVSGS